MTATVDRPVEPPASAGALDRADGVELLGPVRGSGYREGTGLVRRADGRMVQLGPVMYALLECIDGRRTTEELATALGERIGKRARPEQVEQIAERLGQQGLLAGTEHVAPPAPNPLMALRWKFLVTNPRITRAATRPFVWLFSPFVLLPLVLAFAAVVAYVLFDKGLASATSQAFTSPGLLLLVFVLAVLSAGIHELGHAAACRYGGAEPRGMGAGLYLVWPCFYTDVTDAYRLDRRGRLRVDLGGLYFNAVVAVATMAVWLAVRKDALLLLVAMQLLQMVRQLSPVIRADGYHILADTTGVPDLFAHMGPTLRRLLPGRRHRAGVSPLRGRTRVFVTVWVLVMIPILASLTIGAILVLPRLLTSAWDSGRHIATQLPHQSALGVGASLLELLALVLPAVGVLLMAQRMVVSYGRKAIAYCRGYWHRKVVVGAVVAAIVAGLAYAWWPAGQYQPVRASERGTIGSLVSLIGSPRSVAQPAPPVTFGGWMLALVMTPKGGATAAHPTLVVLPGASGQPPTVVLAPGKTGVQFPFSLPSKPTGPGDSQALAVNTTDGGVVYDVEYALVEVSGGAPVTQTNGAYAIASCKGCTTVAVSFQVVLVIGQSNTIAPVNEAEAANYQCPQCVTTALADQLVITLSQQPSAQLQAELEKALSKLNHLTALGSDGTPAEVAAQVAAVQQEIEQDLEKSGLLTSPLPSASPSTASGASASASPDATSTTGSTDSSAPTATSSTAPAPTGGSGSASPQPSASTTPAATASGSSPPSATPSP